MVSTGIEKDWNEDEDLCPRGRFSPGMRSNESPDFHSIVTPVRDAVHRADEEQEEVEMLRRILPDVGLKEKDQGNDELKNPHH